MPITNLNIYLAVAEEAAAESIRLYEEGRMPRPDGGGHIITFDPDAKSFKQSFIAIAFAGMYLEALLGLACTARLGKDLYKKIERQTTYEEKLKLLGVLDPDVLDRCKRFREARNDLMHERAVDLGELGTALLRKAQTEAKFAIELVRVIGGNLKPRPNRVRTGF